MYRFNFNKEKGISALVYIAKKLGKDKSDLHSVIKALYFAEQRHLVRYGRPITGDIYSAMKNGPVPSALYDLCKEVRESGSSLNDSLQVTKKSFITPISEPDLGLFSKSDLECLDEAIVEIDGLDFDERTEKSHDPAYTAAWNKRGELQSSRISFLDIAVAGGADDEMQSYLKNELEFTNAFC